MRSGDIRVGAVLLAAGGSSRLGQPKQLLSLKGQSLLRRAARTALVAGSGPVVVVLGAQAERMQQEVADLPVEMVINADWEAGMASSLRAGLQALTASATVPDAAFFLLCDQPFLTPEVLNAHREAHTSSGRPASVSVYEDGATGPPCLFAASLFPQLLTLKGAQGAKQLLARLPDDLITRVSFPKGTCDIDTLEDWHRLTQDVRSL